MLKQTALMESLSANLHDFLKITGQNLSLPNKKFLRDGFIGLLRAGKPIVCRMARQISTAEGIVLGDWILPRGWSSSDQYKVLQYDNGGNLVKDYVRAHG